MIIKIAYAVKVNQVQHDFDTVRCDTYFFYTGVSRSLGPVRSSKSVRVMAESELSRHNSVDEHGSFAQKVSELSRHTCSTKTL